MCRLLLGIVLVGTTLPGAEAPPANTPAAFVLTAGANRVYAYSVKTAMQFESAGDRLAYTSTLTWKFVLTVSEATTERAVLDATILRVMATHEGPGSRRQIDTGGKQPTGADDTLLGHLHALDGAVLRVVLDPVSGTVSEVTGGEAIVARLNQREPARIAGDPPPLDGLARSAFSSAALTRLWRELLARPRATPERVPLGPPLNGEVERVWQGTSFTVRLAGDQRPTAALGDARTPVTMTLNELNGTGSVSTEAGLPGKAGGEMTFVMSSQALTQPVVLRYTLAWELVPLP
jgi:hypothetical protein